jgi:hypothetical protein
MGKIICPPLNVFIRGAIRRDESAALRSSMPEAVIGGVFIPERSHD